MFKIITHEVDKVVAKINFLLKKSNAKRKVCEMWRSYINIHAYMNQKYWLHNINFLFFIDLCDLFLQRQVLAYEGTLIDKDNKIKILYIKYHWQLKVVSYIQWVSDVSLLAGNMNQNVFSVHYLP
jgi:hypothetical protein